MEKKLHFITFYGSKIITSIFSVNFYVAAANHRGTVCTLCMCITYPTI